MATQNRIGTESDGIVARVKAEIDTQGPMAFVQRTVTIEGVPGVLEFGVHGPFCEHYGTEPGQFPEKPTTNEVFGAAVVACLTGTFVAMLELRGIVLARDDLSVTAEIDMGPPLEAPSPWIVRAVTVNFEVAVSEGQRGKVERVHGMYDQQCWLSQTLKGSRCKVSSALTFA